MLRETLKPWKLGGLTPWEVARRAAREFRRQHLDARSAQFAYYAMLAIAPLLILTIAALAQLPLDGALDAFLAGADRALPAAAGEVIRKQVREIQTHSSATLAIFALVVLGYAGSMLFLTISRGLNTAYEVVERRRYWHVQALALSVTLGAFLLMLAALIVLVIGPELGDWLLQRVDIPAARLLLIGGLRWIVVGVAVLAATSAIYRLAPDIRGRWSPLSPGNVVATLGWFVISLGFRYYVENFA